RIEGLGASGDGVMPAIANRACRTYDQVTGVGNQARRLSQSAILGMYRISWAANVITATTANAASTRRSAGFSMPAHSRLIAVRTTRNSRPSTTTAATVITTRSQVETEFVSMAATSGRNCKSQ